MAVVDIIFQCIRVSEPETRGALIAELVTQSNMEKLLRDSFANYVIQTCLDYADPDQRVQLVECIRPLLPSIRSTPYGKRIHSKIQRDPQQHNRQRQRQQMQYQNVPSMRLNAMSAEFPLSYDAGLLGNDPIYPYQP